jgi:hypothetical protein
MEYAADLGLKTDLPPSTVVFFGNFDDLVLHKGQL